MTINFFIEPTLPNGEPVKSELIKIWYVRESNYIHCTCSSWELAQLMLKHIEQVHQDFNKFREEERDKINEKTLSTGTVFTQSRLANAAVLNAGSNIDELKHKVKVNKSNIESRQGKNNNS
ncbi:hypothetical protein [Pseudomonas syringae group genomosp. 7]|uniref:hypothetical protein n=1 Tax=Pseudomonas syringae group genomosp. 7 TaxID=251699 RepID=UPI000EFF7C91|nr:hypothetical protein [Pseudomonas syringae group genomosp. 7]